MQRHLAQSATQALYQGRRLAPVQQRLEFLHPRLELRAALLVEVMAQRPQLLHHVTHVQREDRLGKQRLQVVLQSGCSVGHDLHRLGGFRAEATLGRLRTRPQCRCLAARERPPTLSC